MNRSLIAGTLCLTALAGWTTWAGPTPAAAAPAIQSDDTLGVIEGNVFLDEDADGRFDPAERPLADFEVRLEGPDERMTVTRANGRFRFEDLPAGKYTVRVERNENQRDTYASSIRYEDLEVDGTILTGIDFGMQTKAGTREAADGTSEEGSGAAEAGEAAAGAGMSADETTGAMDAEGTAEEAAGTADDDAEAGGAAESAAGSGAPSSAPSMPAVVDELRDLMRDAANAGRTVDDLDASERAALDATLAGLTDDERMAIDRALATDVELATLARSTGADVLLLHSAGDMSAGDAAKPAAAAETTAPSDGVVASGDVSHVDDMPRAGAGDLFGWPMAVASALLLALLGTLGLVAERRSG